MRIADDIGVQHARRQTRIEIRTAQPLPADVPPFEESEKHALSDGGTLLTVYSARLDSGMNFLETQPLRGNTTVDVTVLSTAPSIGSITGSPVTFTGVPQSAGALATWTIGLTSSSSGAL